MPIFDPVPTLFCLLIGCVCLIDKKPERKALTLAMGAVDSPVTVRTIYQRNS